MLTVLAACTGGDSRTYPGANRQQAVFQVTAAGDEWPFVFDAGELRCQIVTLSISNFGRSSGNMRRRHVTINTDGETYGVNDAAMNRWPGHKDLVDPEIDFAGEMRALSLASEWVTRALSACSDPINGFVGPWSACR